MFLFGGCSVHGQLLHSACRRRGILYFPLLSALVCGLRIRCFVIDRFGIGSNILQQNQVSECKGCRHDDKCDRVHAHVCDGITVWDRCGISSYYCFVTAICGDYQLDIHRRNHGDQDESCITGKKSPHLKAM
jgi:hypothetical protein